MSHSTKMRIDIRRDIHKIADLYKVGKTSYELASMWGCSRCVITTVLKKFGYSLRQSHKRKGIKPWNYGKPYLAVRGNKNPNWKGGITPLNQAVRHCWKYKNWIREIFKRDGYTCQTCQKRGGHMEADHYPKLFCQILFDNKITNLAEAIECDELWDIENGRTLCLKCHKRGNIRPVRSRLKMFGVTY